MGEEKVQRPEITARPRYYSIYEQLFLNKNVSFISKWISVFIFYVFENLVIFYFAILFLINENKRYSPKINLMLFFERYYKTMSYFRGNTVEQKLNKQFLPPVPSSKEDLDALPNKVHSVILNHMKLIALCVTRFVRKIAFGGILS